MLVAKQVWRMLEKPDSLVAQVFKARYFKNCDIMEAQIGNNSSFTWKSLCWGKELLREGLGWIIVNGKDINASEMIGLLTGPLLPIQHLKYGNKG